jgi:ATP-dependent phosphofructokinase / diphosphate-dependent phosphofructokinase
LKVEKKALVYLQSGGPTAVINSSLFGVISEAKKHQEIGAILGSMHGVEGLIDDDLVDLRAEDPEQVELLKQTPGAILGSTRKKLPAEISDPIYQKLLATVKRHKIGYILVNGGNDSMDSCNKLSRLFLKEALSVNVIGIPKTIDNDLLITDHSLGYPSAAKHIINTVKAMTIDSSCYRKGKVLIIEIMGRDAGWLTASVDMLEAPSRPDLIYLPEASFSCDGFLADVAAVYGQKGYAAVAVSEGIPVKNDNCKPCDAFGHKTLEGVSITLSRLVEEKLGIPTRSMELSIPQRSDPLLASKVDQKEAIAASRFAVKSVIEGASGKMVCLTRLSGPSYKVRFVLRDVSKIANYEKKIPSSMLGDSHGLSPTFRRYLAPLLIGEPSVKYENGIFCSARFTYRKAK